eukprot:PhM_4_TR18947/c1_g1_i1/m.59768
MQQQQQQPSADLRGILTDYFALYEPRKLTSIDTILAKFGSTPDHAQALVDVLVDKYGELPTTVRGYPLQVRMILRRYDPSRERETAQLLRRFQGCESDLLESLVARYGNCCCVVAAAAPRKVAVVDLNQLASDLDSMQCEMFSALRATLHVAFYDLDHAVTWLPLLFHAFDIPYPDVRFDP